MQRFLRTFLLIALVWPMNALAEEKPPGLAFFEQMIFEAPPDTVSYEEATAVGERGFEVKGLKFRTISANGEAGFVSIDRVVVRDLAPLPVKDGPPTQLDLRVENMVLTPENSELDKKVFAALGADRLPINLALSYLYLPNSDVLSIQAFTLDIPFMARLSLTLDGAKINLARLILASEVTANEAVLRQATLTFTDVSLLSRLLLFEAKNDGVTFKEAQDEALRELAEELNWVGAPRDGRLWSLAEAVGGLLLDAATPKGPLTVTIRPTAAVAIGEVLKAESPEQVAKILNLRASYPGSRANFASTQSETPGRAELSLDSDKPVYKEGETVVIRYDGLPGNQRDWVTVVPLGTPADNWGQWTYTDGKVGGSFEIEGLAPGSYEARVYFDWPNGGFEVARSWPFTVEP